MAFPPEDRTVKLTACTAAANAEAEKIVLDSIVTGVERYVTKETSNDTVSKIVFLLNYTAIYVVEDLKSLPCSSHCQNVERACIGSEVLRLERLPSSLGANHHECWKFVGGETSKGFR